MATDKQIEANRKNAQRSTGPKTPHGKEASKYNALKHALYSQDVALLYGRWKEDKEALAAYLDLIEETLDPRDPVQAILARNISLQLLRLDRLQTWESRVLDGAAHEVEMEVLGEEGGVVMDDSSGCMSER